MWFKSKKNLRDQTDDDLLDLLNYHKQVLGRLRTIEQQTLTHEDQEAVSLAQIRYNLLYRQARYRNTRAKSLDNIFY